MSVGKTLKIYVRGSNSRALKSVELVNWTGQAFLGRREHIAQIREIEQLREPGIYLLIRESADDQVTRLYIGETDDFVDRITTHIREKDWWSHFIVFVSKDKNLTKAHVRHLEAELYKLGKNSMGLEVDNPTIPGGSKLPESDVSAMTEYLSNMIFVLETLSLGYFSVPQKAERPNNKISSRETFYLNLKEEGTSDHRKAIMSFEGGEYVLKAGSFIKKSAVPSFEKDSYYPLWKKVAFSDSVRESNSLLFLEVSKDIAFQSPSAAGSIVKGRTVNGQTSWRRVADEKPLAECELETE